MPKAKTHQATAKRIRRTKSGKLLRKHANARHLLVRKSSRRKRRLAKTARVDRVDRSRYSQLLGGKK